MSNDGKDGLKGSEVTWTIESREPELEPPFYSSFDRTRTMPIVNAIGTRGFYVFASQQSFDVFKNTGFKEAKLNAEGVGIPLFHMVEEFGVTSEFSGKKPLYIIHKFITQKLDDPPPYDKFKMILEDDTFCLYKIPFCEIVQNMQSASCTYSFQYPLHPENVDSYSLIDTYHYQDYRAIINGRELSWKTDLNFMFEAWHYKLHMNSDNKPVIATYSTKDCDYLPRKMFKCAKLLIQEETGPDALGNSSVAWLTQVLACQGALIHRLIRDGSKALGT